MQYVIFHHCSSPGKLSVAKSTALVGTDSMPACSVWQRFWAVDDDVDDDDDGRDGGGGGDCDTVSLCILFVVVAAEAAASATAEAMAPPPNLHVSSKANVSLLPE